MTSIVLVSLVFLLFLNNMHCHIWSYIKFNNSVNLSVINTFNCDSKICCAIRCSASYSVVVMTVQDGACYCLNPQLTPFGFEDQINVPSVYSRIPKECILKSYQSFPDLGICVKYSTFSATWEDAKDHCNQDGSYLININTPEKFATISNFTDSYTEDYVHIGGFTDGVSRTYKWTRGDPVDQFWSANEPNGFPNERCMAIYRDQRGVLDIPCAWSQFFICEILF